MNATGGHVSQFPKVPGVNVFGLGLAPTTSAEPGTPLPADVLGDIVRVEVTQVNSGLSSYTITLNNWFLGTANDRKNPNAAALAARGPAERMTPSGSPFWPRFKYNDFGLLTFGQRLRIDMRFWPGEVGSESGTISAQDWVPMVSGPITDMRFAFATGQGAQLTVSGEDDLSLLKDKQDKRVPMDTQAEVAIVKKVLSAANFSLRLAPPTVAYPKFATDDAHGIQEAVQAGSSWLDLINKLAERLDFEVFAEFRERKSAQEQFPPPLEFHFEPYRGRAPYNEQQRSIYRLDRERNLLDFNPTIKVGDQYSVAEVRGRHRDPLLAKEVVGKATHEILNDELQRDPALDGALQTGPQVRAAFFKGRVSRFSVPNQTNLDEARADANAEAVIRKKARELFVIEVTAVGDPRLRPGRYVEIRGMRPPFDGFYYITKAVHSYGTDGLRTKLSACRPGMELPNGGKFFEPASAGGTP